MNITELRLHFTKFMSLNTIEIAQEAMAVYLNLLFSFMTEKHSVQYSVSDHEARTLLQMVFSKVSHLKILSDGFSYVKDNKILLNTIVDPVILATLTRNLIETICTFSIVYIHPKAPDTIVILYNLWVHAGLAYRQRFTSRMTLEENKIKSVFEKKAMTKLKEEIVKTDLFSRLPSKETKKLENCLKQKDYKVIFNDTTLDTISWREAMVRMGLKDYIVREMYTYLSLYSHPSNVSVFQYRKMFDPAEKRYISLSLMNIKLSIFILSCFVADYISIFPENRKLFDNLELRHQNIINGHLSFARGEHGPINNSLSSVG